MRVTDPIVDFLLARFFEDGVDRLDPRMEIMGEADSLSPDQRMLTLRTLAMPYMDHPDFDPGWSTL